MGLTTELKGYYASGGNTLDPRGKYLQLLNDDDAKDLYSATVRLFGAYAKGGVGTSRMLDYLAPEGCSAGFVMLKRLIREYGQGIEDILDAYDAYFSQEEKPDFWSLFDEELNLPEGWRDNIGKGARQT